MAKSLRAKDKLKARNVLRKKVFEPVENARLQQVVEKLHAQKQEQTNGESMQVDEEKKVSTSGWKGSRNDTFKQKGGKKHKKKNSLVFKKAGKKSSRK